MSHRHKVKIEKLFEHPISANIDVKRLISALEHYGCAVEITKQSRMKISINNEDFVMSLSHKHDLSKDAIINLRNFLVKVGLSPENLE